MKFDIIVADPPYSFNDKLKGDIDRSAESHYDVLSNDDIKNLNIESIAEDDSVLALWIPSSKIQTGLEIVEAWGFKQTQTFIWVKMKNEPFKDLIKMIDFGEEELVKSISNFDLNGTTKVNMGRWFRQSHEICLIGVRGKVYSKLKNRSQRSVLFSVGLRHSSKPEGLQDRLELMIPNGKYLEMFARRQRKDWICIGLESPNTIGEDIRDSIKKLD